MSDELMEERRRLFLQEMARIREDGQKPEPTQASLQQHADPPSPPRMCRPASPHPVLYTALVVVCLALISPVFSYGRRQAEGVAALQSKQQAAQDERNDAAWRRERVLRARSFFGLPGIVAVRRSKSDLFLVLKPAVSHAEVVVQAWHVRAVLAGRAFRSPPPAPWRVVLCSGDAPCTVSIARVPSAPNPQTWRVMEETVVASTF